MRRILLLVCFTLSCNVLCQKKALSPGAKQCFDKYMSGVQIRRVKLGFCDATDRIIKTGGYPFDPNGMEIRIGNVLFNKNSKRTVLLKNTEVQICMFGKLDTDRLRDTPRLQISAHGKPESFPAIAGVKINLPDLGINADFCDLKPDGCATTEPSCDAVIPGQGEQDFCSCATLTVPDYAPAGTDVEITWKLMEIPSSADPTKCEKKFDIRKLWEEEKKETLNCIKIDGTVKSCDDLKTKSIAKIKGC